MSNRLYLTGLIGAVTKWLGFHDTSWWLVLLPIYGQFLLLIVVLLLFLPILAFSDSGTSASDEDDPSPG